MPPSTKIRCASLKTFSKPIEKITFRLTDKHFNFEELYDKEYEYSSTYQDFISNIRTVKALNNNKYFEKIIKYKGKECYKKQNKYVRCYSLEELIRNILIIIPFALAIIKAVYDLSNGIDTLGIITFYISIYLEMGFIFDELSGTIVSFFELKALRKKCTHLFKKLDERKIINYFDKITLENIKIKYKESNFDIIVDNMIINNNDKVSITGKSGQGKTSIINLILGNISTYSGNIFIDKSNLKSVRLDIGVVSQEIELFNMTIKDNLCLDKSISDNEIIKYLNELSGKETDDINLGKEAYDWYVDFRIMDVMNYNRYSENASKIKFRDVTKKTASDDSRKTVCLYAWVRLLYSMLVAADYYATSEYMTGWEQNIFGNINNVDEIIAEYEHGTIQKSIREYEKNTYPLEEKSLKNIGRDTEIGDIKGINILRTEIFLDSEKTLSNNLDKNIFYLEAPTGSGKSNMSMNLSFKLMQNSGTINKIFYIYPFNTLVEQNMNSLENVFGSNEKIMAQIAVVNSITPFKDMKEEEIDKNYQRILLDRQFLNYPVVLSTHVMLFETMFGNNKENAFGFHQLCNSVIVLDEIQSYNNALWGRMITFLKEFAELLNIKIIIMSATLPNLEMLTDNNSEVVRLITNRDKYFKHYMFAKRVEIDYSLIDKKITIDELADFICNNKENNGKKILVEFIKKKTAQEFYRVIKDMTDAPVLLITGDSSIKERNDIINKVNNLSNVILVATQVIEAGVDIDMDIGYKDISRLDSEEQFMGRINRSGKKIGKVYFYNLDNAKDIYKEDVRVDSGKTLENSDVRSFLTKKNFFEYYEKMILPALIKRQGKLTNDNIKDFFKKNVGKLFKA